MKRASVRLLCLICLLGLGLFASATVSSAAAAKPVRVDVLYMNHGPLKPTLQKMADLFATYKDVVVISWHDFESAEGEKFMAAKGIKNHVPLMIWINDADTVQVQGAKVSFTGFPSGSGPAMFQGKWSMDLLAKALNQATGRK
jgi:hypothetical protein